MPPTGGRPSAGGGDFAAGTRRSNRRDADFEWDERQGRFVPVVAEGDEPYYSYRDPPAAYQMGRREFVDDKTYYAERDLMSIRHRQGVPEMLEEDVDGYDLREYGHGSGGYHDGRDQDSRRWQAEMLQQEKQLVDGALRRIDRARMRGEANPPLTREELDALERHQLITVVPKQATIKAVATSSATSKPATSKPKRKAVGGGGATNSATNTLKSKGSKTDDRRTSLPESLSSSGRRESVEEMGPTSYYQMPPPGSRHTSSPLRPSSHSISRQTGVPDPREYYTTAAAVPPPQPALPRMSPNEYEYAASRSRAGSAATQGYPPSYPYPPQYGAVPQQVYYPQVQQQGSARRNVSGPAALSSHASSASRRSGAAGSRPGSRNHSAIGLSQHDVVEISSDSQDGEYDSEDSGSDRGVTLYEERDMTASGHSSGTLSVARTGNRQRKGRR